MNEITFWVPALPEQALSANGGGRSRRDPWSLSEAKLSLGDVTYHAVLAAYAPNIPTITPPVVISVTLYVRHNTRNGDGLYRPKDPSNIGGDVLKPIIDYGLVRHGIIPDDDYLTVESVVLRVRHVQTLIEEGFSVSVRTFEPAPQTVDIGEASEVHYATQESEREEQA